MKKSGFTYDHRIHNLDGPGEITRIVYNLIKPESVVDLGCGVGAFLKSFKDLGVRRVLGIDNHDVFQSSVPKYLEKNEFMNTSLEVPIELPEKFDLAICLEVAEHLNPDCSEILADNLIKLSDVILFSAAIPFQKGENHLNEQWPDYWQNIFRERDFLFYDILRKELWNNEKISYWHRQNTFLVVKKSKKLGFTKGPDEAVSNIIHPVLYLKKAEALEKLLKGDFRILFYMKLLTRSVIKRLSNFFAKVRSKL